MPYRLKRKEPLADGIRRIAREEAGKAVASAAGGESSTAERVHDARTHCKKLRGLLRLARPHLGETYGRENAHIRQAAKELSASRDAEVVLHAFDDLARRGPLDRDAVAALRPALEVQFGASERNEAERLAAFACAMEELLVRIDDWHVDDDTFRAIGDGLTDVYRRGRQAMRQAFESGDSADWHEWRKQSKYHWYHVRLLRNAWKPTSEACSGELRRLSDLLGDDHDLAVLRQTAAELTGVETGHLGPLLALADRRRAELQQAARPLGERLYAEKPAALAKRMRWYWKVWRGE